MTVCVCVCVFTRSGEEVRNSLTREGCLPLLVNLLTIHALPPAPVLAKCIEEGVCVDFVFDSVCLSVSLSLSLSLFLSLIQLYIIYIYIYII